MKSSDKLIIQKTHSRRIYMIIIFAIMTVAFLLRFKGIWFGYPLTVHPDEHVLVNSALNMIENKTLHPHTFLYPSLNIYLQAIAYYGLNTYNSITGYSIGDIAKIDYYLIGRTVTVFLSVATIYITFEIGKRLFNEIIGILAAFFVCVSHLHLAHSYTITVDSPVAFWSALSMLMAVLIYKNGEKRFYYILAGIFAGFAVSSKYTAVFAILPMIIAHIYRVKNRSPKEWINVNLIYGLLMGPVAFICTTPYALLDFKSFIKYLAYQRNVYSHGVPRFSSSGESSLLNYISSFSKTGYGILPIVFACAGLIWLFIKDYWKALLIIILPVTLLLFVGQYKTVFLRNIIAVVPFMAILTGLTIYTVAKLIAEKLKLSLCPGKYNLLITVIIIVMTFGVSFTSANNSIRELKTVTLPDTRWIATKWILENFTTGGLKIAREPQTPAIEEYSDNYLVTHLGWGGKTVQPEAQKVLAQQDYVILSSSMYYRFINHPEKYQEIAAGYNKFFEEHELVKEFKPERNTTGGPVIRIYKINKKGKVF